MAVTKGKGKEVVGSSGSGSRKAMVGNKRKKVASFKGEESGRGKKKIRSSGVLRFIDDAADVEEQDDVSDGLSFLDDLSDEDAGILSEVKPGTKTGAFSVGRSHHLPFFLKNEDLTVEEHEQLIRKHYSNLETCEMDTKQTDQIFSHTSKDLSIWKVKCMIGRETLVTVSLFQKFVHLNTIGTKLPIVSVFALEHIKGCVYIEAEKEADVTEACKGFCNLYATRKSLVTKDEFPRLLSFKIISRELSKGTWVRIKNGNYKGDLAQVVAYDDQHKRVMLKMIPRVDLQALAKKFGGGVSLKESGVPSPRLISSRELEDFRPHIQIKCDRLTGDHFEILDGLMLKEGYLYKKLSITSISWLGVLPSKNEIVKFEAAKIDDAEDLNWLSLVYGEQKRIHVAESENDTENKGVSGSRNGYEVHDIVLFGRKDFGVIIGIKGDSIQILKGDTEEQKLATILRRELKNKCADKMFTASDRHMKTICINDSVRILDGPFEGREGTVRHMYKGFLFIYDETITENCGYICVKSQLCANTKKPKSSKSNAKNDKMGCSSSYMNTGEYVDMEATDTKESVESRRPRWTNTDSPFSIGQTVRIRVGPRKGYLCRVISIYRSKVTVKLDSLGKVMTVNSDDLSETTVKNFGSSVRDTSAATSFNQFSSKDGATDGGWGEPSGNSSWNLNASTTARDDWPGFSTAVLSAPSCDDSKDNASETDPWSSKMKQKIDYQSNATDSWDKGTSSNGGQTSTWNNAGGDTINMKEQTSCWEKDAGVGNSSHVSLDDKSDSWSTKGKTPVGDDDGWSKGNASHRKNVISRNDDCTWGNASKNTNLSSPNIEKMDAWDVIGKSVAGKEADGWGKVAASPNKIVGGADNGSWGGTSETSNQNNSTSAGWKQSSNSWDKKAPLACDQSDDWGKSDKSTNYEQSNKWEKTVPAACDVSDGWGKSDKSIKAASVGGVQNEQSNKWEKTVSSSCDVSDGWGKLDKSTKVAPMGGAWANASEKMGTPFSINESQSSLWEKPKVSSGVPSDNWSKPNSAVENETGGWQKTKALNLGEDDRWNKPESSNSAWGGERDQPNHFNGAQNYSQGRGRGRDFNSEGGRQSSDWGRGGDWSSGGDKNQQGNWNQHGNVDKKSTWGVKCNDDSERKGQDSWNGPSNFGGRGDYNQQSGDDCCGGSGGSRGRGRDQQDNHSGGAFSGNSSNWGNNQQDSWGKSDSSLRNEGWGGKSNDDPERKGQDSWNGPNNFGGRGGYNQQSWDNSNGSRNFGRDGPGGSRGRGRGRGRDQSSFWKNDQQDHCDAAFSGNSSDWGNNQHDSWGKSDSSVSNEGSGTFNRNQGSDWNNRGKNADEAATGSLSSWDSPKTYSSAKHSEWNNNEGKDWSKPKDADSNRSSGWNQPGGQDSGGPGGRSGNWNRGGRSYGGGRGRGRNFNRDKDGQQNSYGNWNQEKYLGGEQSSGGFRGNSSHAGGWSTEKGILESPKSKSDWSSSGWGKDSGSVGKDAGTNQGNPYKSSMGPPKSDGEWHSNSWGKDKDKNGGETSKSKSDWPSSSGWGGNDTGVNQGNTNNGSMGPPKSDGEWHSNSWEKGSSSGEKAELKDAWIQEKTLPPVSLGGETLPPVSLGGGNQVKAWQKEKSSGGWEKPKDKDSGSKGGW